VVNVEHVFDSGLHLVKFFVASMCGVENAKSIRHFV
jgi:hypothetical protein